MEELRNLRQMASLASGRFNQYDGDDFVLPQIFKDKVKEINSNTITYNKYSAIIETKGTQNGILNIFMPNQWFYIASYFTDFYNELQKYKKYALKVAPKERLKELNGKQLSESELNLIRNLNIDETSKKYLVRFITEYFWWGGAKTIDRGDFYVSPILSYANLVNASQSFVADLCAFLSDKQELVQTIINKGLSNEQKKYNRALLFSPCIEGKEGINGFLDRAIPVVLETDSNLSKLNEYADISTSVTLRFDGFVLGKISDKNARKDTINPNITWICDINRTKYCLYRECTYDMFLKFQQIFNLAYKNNYEIVIDTVEYNGNTRKRYSLYALNAIRAFENVTNFFYRPYITAIKSKPFLLLAGISGNGKSRIVRELARACWEEGSKEYEEPKPKNFAMIQVKPNWHDSSELIGYVSRVSGEPVYVAGDFLKFIAKAWENLDVPHFLCLDEMNLAPVEQYFAEYLSVIESRKNKNGEIVTDAIIEKCAEQWYFDLTAKLTTNDDVRTRFMNEGITIPKNLIVVGTVNMDETTFSFSRKVLDRAMTIEMNEVDLEGGLDKKYESIGKLGEAELIGYAVEGVDVYADNKEVCDTAISYLKAINDKLEGTPFKVAYRTRNEFLLYVVNNLPYNKNENGEDIPQEMVIARALDEITNMKILSRIEGDETKVSERFLNDLRETIKKELNRISQKEYSGTKGKEGTEYAVSLAKLKEMIARLGSGYTSFWS